MAVQYHLVLRKNMSKEVEEGKEKLYYAQTRATRTCGFDELCDLIAERSMASSGDVKVVLDRMNKFAAKALERGEVVQLGELGSLQLIMGSKGSATTEGFSSTLLKKARLCFRPGTILRNTTQVAKGERTTIDVTPVTPPAGGGGDRPEIE